MTIFLIELEAKPHRNNPEREECMGAFVNCWVNSTNIEAALIKAKNYVIDQGWEVVSIEDHFIASGDMYLGETHEGKDLLKCFDEASSEGISAIFYTYEQDEDK